MDRSTKMGVAMKQVIMLLLVLTLFLGIAHSETVFVSAGNNGIRVISSTPDETILQFDVSRFDKTEVSIEGRKWHHIRLEKEGITQDKGEPELPVFNRSIIIPNTSLMRYDVYDVVYHDIQLPIAPSKGVITRDTDPATVPYVFGDTYRINRFYPGHIVSLSEPYIMRDLRGVTVRTMPFVYNPVSGTLRIYTSYKIRVYIDGVDTINVLQRSRDGISRAFQQIYENHFVNYNQYRYVPVDDTFGKLLVICHSGFMTDILPYVNWKKQRGIETELINISTIGTTATQLQTYIQNRYNADNSITYVQLVGDAPQIPTLSSGGGGADPIFALVAGSDNYPDIFVGRFSAETSAQVTAQINKAIVYERDLDATDTWLRNAMGIASSEGAGIGDNGESDIQHMNIIRTVLMNYGYQTVDQLYEPSATAAQVTNNVNAGRGIVNYVGHGSNTSWSTTGFNSTNANALTNGRRTPVIMNVACVNGNFVSITCFAEAWLRNANGGAVTMYASTINQSWASPMRAQDEFNELLTNISAFGGRKYTAGGLYFNGSCRMMDIYGNTTGSDGVNMYRTWTIFGDAALSVRTKTPMTMTVNHPANIPIGQNTVSVSTGVANALIGITHNNTIYGRGYSGGNGNATINLVNPPQTAITYTITVTALDRITYVGSIQQILSGSPNLAVTSVVYTDTNNNLPEYNETGRYTVTFKNIGNQTANNITATISTTSDRITFTDNTESIASLAAGASVTRTNAYAFNVANNIPDQLNAPMTINMVSGTGNWTHNFNQLFNAPALAYGNVIIQDPLGNNNGRLDPGETVTVLIPLNNTGGAASPSGTGYLTCSTPGITINNGSSSFASLGAGGGTNLSFSVTAAAGMTVGTVVNLQFNATAGAYSATKSENLTVGLILEDFETGNFNAFPWTFGGNLPWTITNTGAQQGTSAAKSGAITHNQTTSLQTTRVLNTAGEISFWYRVSSEANYDFLRFFIDGVQQNQWSGTIGWTRVTYPVTAGTRTFRWLYYKDDSVNTGDDCAWVDYIIFPASTEPSPFVPPQNLAAVAGNGFVNLTWQAARGRAEDERTAREDRAISGYRVYRYGSFIGTTNSSTLTYTDTNVVNGTTYTYYVTALYTSPNGESDPSNSVQATPTAQTALVAELGTGTSATGTSEAAPINIYYKSLHGQSVYMAAELNAAGVFGPLNITSIGFYVVSTPNLALPNFIIRMKHTTAANVASWQTSDGMVTVYSNPSYMPVAGNYHMLTLNTPFLWNGIDNIVVDTAFNMVATWSSSGTVRFTAITDGYRFVRSDTANQGNIFTGGSTSTFRPNIRLVFTPTGGGNPAISVSPMAISETLAPDQSIQRTVTITNTGTATLNWQISGRNTDNTIINPPQKPLMGGAPAVTLRNLSAGRTLAGSTVIANPDQYTAGQTQNWSITVTNNSPDGTWIKSVMLVFPSSVTVNAATAMTGSSYPLAPNVTSGNGVSITWTGEYPGYPAWGVVLSGESTTTTLNVSINAGTTGNIVIPWSLYGDEYGATPYDLSGYLTISSDGGNPPTGWLSVNTTSGSISAGQSQNITLTLNSTDMDDGVHNRTLTISSNASNSPTVNINVSLTVVTPVSPYPYQPRFIAEYEPMTAALIRYPLGIPYSIVRELAADNLLYTVVSSANQTTAYNNYVANNVNIANCRWIIAASDSYWIRDYGPWFIMDGNNEMKVVDFEYNRPRPTDNAIPAAVASNLGIGIYQSGIIHSGGNIMSDGQGKAMSTNLVLTENPSLTQHQVNSIMHNYLGVTEYQLYNDPNGTYINHIDCWAKILDVDKVMIRSVPPSHPRFNQIEAVVAEFQTKTSSWGTPYRIYRVNTPNNEPYSNAYVLNKKIFVPLMNNANDPAAILAYQNAMPGYNVIGFLAGSNAWAATDAIHCRINSIPDQAMIYIRHLPPQNIASGITIEIEATISHHNSLIPANVYVAWRHSTTAPWTHTQMTNIRENIWTASIPTPDLAQTLYYMINAQDTTLRQRTVPLCGKDDPFKVLVTQVGYVSAPEPILEFTESSASISWTPVPHATIYKIFASDTPDGEFVLIGTTSGTTWSESLRNDVQARFYRIVAVATPQ